MRLGVIGAGYVGLVAAACFADRGNHVSCVDLDQVKVAKLEQGILPIYEPGLEAIVSRGVAAGRLRFTGSYKQAVAEAEVVFIAVGTPPDEDGSADLSHVLSAARQIAQAMQGSLVVVNKSTVPVGTGDKVQAVIDEVLARRGLDWRASVVSNPEFLKEGAAIDDFMRPDRIILGSRDPHALQVMRRLYAPFCRNHDRIIQMDLRSAELTKYAANAMLATRISFMNELANLSDAVGADIDAVRRGIGSDERIGPHFLYSGIGYGGSCFPKDVQALKKTAAQNRVALRVIDAVEDANETQKRVLFNKISEHFAASLQGRVIAVWGLALKPNTDDMREASSRVLIEALVEAGCRVQAYDPVAGDVARGLFSHWPTVTVFDNAQAALEGADALAVVTEWKEFHSPDFRDLALRLRAQALFDGRNLYDPTEVTASGLYYHGIGRGAPNGYVHEAAPSNG